MAIVCVLTYIQLCTYIPSSIFWFLASALSDAFAKVASFSKIRNNVMKNSYM